MRAGLGLIGLLLSLAVVFWLINRQTTPLSATAPVPPGAAVPAGIGQGTPQQVQDQYRKAMEDAMKPARERSADE